MLCTSIQRARWVLVHDGVVEALLSSAKDRAGLEAYLKEVGSQRVYQDAHHLVYQTAPQRPGRLVEPR
jgi:hypothetical protein